MDWSKTKTIFIVVFLILNVFLVSSFIRKVSESNLDTLGQWTIEEQLKSENIKYPKDLSNEIVREPYIEAVAKKFKSEDLKDLKNQDARIVNENTVNSVLKDPLPISEKFKPEELNEFMKVNMIDGDKYSYWDIDKEKGTITYFQTYKDRKIYNNTNGMIVFQLNQSNEIVSYTQTMFDSIKELSDEQKQIITPFSAFSNLYNTQRIPAGSTVQRPVLGYSTFVPWEESQVLAPTWHFVVKNGDETEDYYQNAFEGQFLDTSTTDKDKPLE
ncbi:two-component system regulatory protein YycI [Rossellomorea marisflavi]|uniref:two-component system regulatory protein YycI n=1 Tax=Rossellomorea marisflavi TaxID=189381 RepID=UPI003514E447